jgi:hypothetical protein
MNFCFHTAAGVLCQGRLWATGRYGFSLPKKVEITTPDGVTHTYLYANRKVQLKSELANRAIVRIAVAQFLAQGGTGGRALDVDTDIAPFAGALTPTRPADPRTPLRVHPGKLHGRQARDVELT